METLGTAILIKPDKPPERTESGKLIIPGNTRELLPQTGIVLQVGKACRDVKVGAHVKFPRKSASVIVIDDEDLFFTNEYKVFYIKEKK